MLPNKFKKPPPNRVLRLNNATCPYCGVELTPDNVSKEHVIGRNFVPKGTLDRQWNLIVRACNKCNSAKADLEDDISAITLAGRVWFGSRDCDELVLKAAQRKSEKSISRKTGKLVKHSREELNFEVPFATGATFNFNCITPPQTESFRLFELARMQITAFFYFITFNWLTKKGGFLPGCFYPLSVAHHTDWGNALQKAFMDAVVAWEPRWIGDSADGFFRSIIRRHPHEECWSWALEWNKNYRLIGFFGDQESAQALFNTFPVLEMRPIPTRDGSILRFRDDVELVEEDDVLFVWDDEKPNVEKD